MSTIANTIVTVIILLAPVGLIYAWIFYARQIAGKAAGWRGRMTLAALVLVSLTVLLWPVARMTMPAANWGTGVGVGEQVRWVQAWERGALRILLGALVLTLFGRPRLIVPITMACVGTGLFWIFSDIP
jgi:hypothetical protein